MDSNPAPAPDRATQPLPSGNPTAPDSNKRGRWRFVAWAGLVTLLTINLGFFVRLFISPRWLWVNPGLIFALLSPVGVGVIIGLTWLGWRRGWATRHVLGWGYGIFVTAPVIVAIWIVFAAARFRERAAGYEIYSNLGRLSNAAGMFYLENPDRLFVAYDELVGPEGLLIRDYGRTSVSRPVPRIVTGEDYRVLFPIRRDKFENLALTLPDGRRIVYLTDEAGDKMADGVHSNQFPGGVRFDTTYHGGVPDGPFRAYYADGRLWCEATYRQGRVVGPRWLHTQDGKVFDECAGGPAEAHYTLGLNKFRAGEFADAIVEFNRALELNPLALDVLSSRADAKRWTGDFAGAFADYTRAIETFPDDPMIHYRRGLVRRLLNDLPGAAEDFRAASGITPGRFERASFMLYLTDCEQGRTGAATAELSGMLERTQDPRSSPWGRMVAGFLLGRVPESQLRAQAERPGPYMGRRFETRFYAAMLHRLAGDRTGALRCFHEALAIAMTNSWRSCGMNPAEEGDDFQFERAEARRALEALERSLPAP